jgi:hypothetical protein
VCEPLEYGAAITLAALALVAMLQLRGAPFRRRRRR